jgi:hypothetical protein
MNEKSTENQSSSAGCIGLRQEKQEEVSFLTQDRPRRMDQSRKRIWKCFCFSLDSG